MQRLLRGTRSKARPQPRKKGSRETEGAQVWRARARGAPREQKRAPPAARVARLRREGDACVWGKSARTAIAGRAVAGRAARQGSPGRGAAGLAKTRWRPGRRARAWNAARAARGGRHCIAWAGGRVGEEAVLWVAARRGLVVAQASQGRARAGGASAARRARRENGGRGTAGVRGARHVPQSGPGG